MDPFIKGLASEPESRFLLLILRCYSMSAEKDLSSVNRFMRNWVLLVGYWAYPAWCLSYTNDWTSIP